MIIAFSIRLKKSPFFNNMFRFSILIPALKLFQFLFLSIICLRFRFEHCQCHKYFSFDVLSIIIVKSRTKMCNVMNSTNDKRKIILIRICVILTEMKSCQDYCNLETLICYIFNFIIKKKTTTNVLNIKLNLIFAT